jgi:hypothetical protein
VKGIFGHAKRQEPIVGALEFASDETPMVGGFAEEVNTGLGNLREFNVEPVADFDAGDAFEEGVVRVREQGLENGVIVVHLTHYWPQMNGMNADKNDLAAGGGGAGERRG